MDVDPVVPIVEVAFGLNPMKVCEGTKGGVENGSGGSEVTSLDVLGDQTVLNELRNKLEVVQCNYAHVLDELAKLRAQASEERADLVASLRAAVAEGEVWKVKRTAALLEVELLRRKVRELDSTQMAPVDMLDIEGGGGTDL